MRMLVQLCQTLDKVPDEVSTAVCLLALSATSTLSTAGAVREFSLASRALQVFLACMHMCGLATHWHACEMV